MNQEITCAECQSECTVDGEYPEFFAWCDTCGDYAKGFDELEFGTDYISDRADSIEDSTGE